MTTQTLTGTLRLQRAEHAVVQVLHGRLREACSLNCAYLLDTGGDGDGAPTHLAAQIHVRVGTTEETSDAAIEVLGEALADVWHIFPAPSIDPDVVIVSDGSDLYVRHSIRIDFRAPYEHDHDWI